MEVKEIRQIKTKEKNTEILDANSITKCNSCERICISFDNESNCCCNSAITVQTSNKVVIYRVCPSEILYIAIEDRKSVLYLINGRVETNYLLEHWKKVLDNKNFAQPHHSFIVNLKYVNKITKEFVVLKFGDTEYSVYTSYRKIGAFKKAFLEFNGQ